MQANSQSGAPIIVGISGGSGAAIAARIIDTLLESRAPVVVTITAGGRQVWAQEMEEPFTRALDAWSGNSCFSFHSANQVGAPIASGSIATRGMIVAPCSMATVAGIAHGLADNLLRRAADVTLKERRPLVLIPRETPLSAIHLENMQRLSTLGATILVPAPAFYLRPRTVDDIVDYIAGKALTALDPAAFPLPASLRYSAAPEQGAGTGSSRDRAGNVVSESEEE